LSEPNPIHRNGDPTARGDARATMFAFITNSIMSDLKNILTAIVTKADLAADSVTSRDQTPLRLDLREIRAAAAQGASLVDDVIRLAAQPAEPAIGHPGADSAPRLTISQPRS